MEEEANRLPQGPSFFHIPFHFLSFLSIQIPIPIQFNFKVIGKSKEIPSYYLL